MKQEELQDKLEKLCLQFASEALGIADEYKGMQPIMELVNKHVSEVIGEDDTNIVIRSNQKLDGKEFGESIMSAVNSLKDEQRKRAGL